jgi:uncharacterized protein
MKSEFDASRLDVLAFANAAGELSGVSPLAGFSRLAEEVLAEQPSVQLSGDVKWQSRGELRERSGTKAQVWLHLQAQALVPQTCQRCLGPVECDVEVDVHFRFVADEETAAAEDDASEEDVLVLDRRFDLLGLVEDELLLGMPLIPLHEVCPVEVKLAVADPEFEAELEKKPNAFAVLGKLKSSSDKA